MHSGSFLFRTLFLYLAFLTFPYRGLWAQTSRTELEKFGKIFLSPSQPDTAKIRALNNFQSLLKSAIQKDPGVYMADSVSCLAVLQSKDRKLKIFNWECRNSEGMYSYFAIAVTQNEKGGYLIHDFQDKSEEIKNPVYAITTPEKWYGAHYYEIIQKGKGKKRHYVLLGADFNNKISRKKIVETFTVLKDGQLKIGVPLIDYEGHKYCRLILEYNIQVSVSLKYDSKKSRIVFDHLSPPEESLKGQQAFYVPDLSYDALKYKRGRWRHQKDVDARNKTP